MTCEPAIFNPDNALGPAQIPSSSISLAKVRFPSQKGWFLQICTDYYDADSYFCCIPNKAPALPVEMTDLSALIASRLDFLGGDVAAYREDTLGIPVLSTWGGVNGRDKP